MGIEIDKDIWTLTREIAILRDENLELKCKNEKLNEENRMGRDFKRSIYPVMRFLAWCSNNYNESVASQAKALFAKNNVLREAYGEDPLEFKFKTQYKPNKRNA